MYPGRSWPLAVIFLTTGACARDPLEATCPMLSPGDLAVSEIRGKQSSSSDTIGPWVEIFNTSGAQVQLTGLTVSMTNLTGTTTTHDQVRDVAAVVLTGGYFVIDLTNAPPSGGGLDLVACGTVIDHVVYRSLPGTGTLGYDGNKTPDATANDNESAWCVDTTPAGTPQQRNHPCTQ